MGFAGDGRAATAASMNDPVGIALNASGDLFIADQGNSRIRKVSNGIITTVAGTRRAGFSGDGGKATSADLCLLGSPKGGCGGKRLLPGQLQFSCARVADQGYRHRYRCSQCRQR